MSRSPKSAIDATRFTSTTPHATAKPPPSNSSIPKFPTRSPTIPGETPQQRVKRLRAAADRARDAQISTFDKLILRGRVWADKAHRFTALSLIGISVVAGGVTAYALVDMMIYNRRKRAQFFAQQEAKYEAALGSAQQAAEAGWASESQLEFLAKEKEHQKKVKEWEESRRQRGIWAKSKAWLFDGLKKEEEGDTLGTSERRLGYEALSEEDDTMGERESDILRAIEEKKSRLQDKAKSAFESEKERQRSGGPLDRIGTESDRLTPAEERDSSSSWTSWIVRK